MFFCISFTLKNLLAHLADMRVSCHLPGLQRLPSGLADAQASPARPHQACNGCRQGWLMRRRHRTRLFRASAHAPCLCAPEMEAADSLRGVIAREMAAFLLQLRADNNAARQADRQYYDAQFEAIHVRLQNSEQQIATFCAGASNCHTPRTGSTGTSSFSSSQELGSPILQSGQRGSSGEEYDCHRAFMAGFDLHDSGICSHNCFGNDPFDDNADGESAPSETLGSAALTSAAAEPPVNCFTHAAAQASLGLFISPIDASQSTNAPAACEQLPPFNLLAISSEDARGTPPAAAIAGTLGQMKHSSRVCALCRFPFTEIK